VQLVIARSGRPPDVRIGVAGRPAVGVDGDEVDDRFSVRAAGGVCRLRSVDEEIEVSCDEVLERAEAYSDDAARTEAASRLVLHPAPMQCLC
jgi:hypothetical protein